MIGHQDKSDQRKRKSPADFVEDFHGQRAHTSGGQQRPALVATESDEMQVPLAEQSLESFGHKM